MVRLILLSDFSESYPYCLLKGILSYSREQTPWVVCRMPTSYRKEKGPKSLLEWVLRWKTDAVIGQLEPHDDLSLSQKHGINARAHDYGERFTGIANNGSRPVSSVPTINIFFTYWNIFISITVRSCLLLLFFPCSYVIEAL